MNKGYCGKHGHAMIEFCQCKRKTFNLMREFIRDLIIEPERITDEDMREKTLFEAKELIERAGGE